MNKQRRMHWEKVYETKQPREVSWTQDKPQISLDFIHSCNLDKKANIIDIGGGDSKLVDYLIDEGYENITVLDISSTALEKAKHRLGKKADKVTWIISDVTDFKPQTAFDLWHDRATFHFLTSEEDIKKYVNIVERVVSEFLVIGTFSDKGPAKCSGLNIKQYNEHQLTREFGYPFHKIRCLTEDHITPFNTLQNFLFCSFRRVTGEHGQITS
jgi:hypothetical protein